MICFRFFSMLTLKTWFVLGQLPDNVSPCMGAEILAGRCAAGLCYGKRFCKHVELVMFKASTKHTLLWHAGRFLVAWPRLSVGSFAGSCMKPHADRFLFLRTAHIQVAKPQNSTARAIPTASQWALQFEAKLSGALAKVSWRAALHLLQDFVSPLAGSVEGP